MTDNKTPEQKYIELVTQIKDLEAQKDLLNAEIVISMNEQGITNNKLDNGEFLLAWRKSWEYSADTNFLEDQLKAAKKKEENDGTAKIAKSTEYLKFLPKKEQDEN